jgi:very-short-patch-repair endonuclease
MANKIHRPDRQLWWKLEPETHQLRENPTEGEQVLWGKLRNRQLEGYKFRRQHPIGRFIVDFCCPERSLIVEVDGPIHETQKVEDEERTVILESLGYHVIRFTNHEVLAQTNWVLSEILKAIRG